MKKILVIEDEKVTRMNLLKFLESEGFIAIGAENGRIGIQLAKEYLPDLIICDLLMPQLDGYDVLNELQTDSNTVDIPFIFLTIAADREYMRYDTQIGADDYLGKAATSAELRAAIANRLKKQEAVIKKYSSAIQLSQALEQRIYQLEQFVNAKDVLLNRLVTELRERLIASQQEIEILKQVKNQTEQDLYLTQLQQEFARILALLNQVAELQNVLTPENIEILYQFNFLIKDSY